MIAQFRSKLVLIDRPSPPQWELFSALIYDSAVLGFTVVVPEGFQTDLASIPRALWSLLPPVGAYDAAAVVHDLLYQRRTAGVDRGLADAVLNEAMGVLGVGTWTRRAIYWGVRLGGLVPWNRYRAAEQVTV